MGPHLLAPEDLTLNTRCSNYPPLNKQIKKSDDDQITQRALRKTINHQVIRHMENTDSHRPGAGAERCGNSAGLSRKEGENLARKEQVETAQQNGLEYRVFLSSEDATDEDWVMVDISKLVLK